MKSKCIPLAFVLTVILVLSMVPVTALAKSFSDIQGHWGEVFIVRWTDHGVLHGFDDGSFRPNESATRAQMASMLNMLIIFDEATENGFTDVEGDEWYADYFMKLAGAGIIDSTGEARANEAITRGEMFVMLAKAFKLEPIEGKTVFSDDASISSDVKGYLKALEELKIINGITTERGVEAQVDKSLTRAELCVTIDYVVKILMANSDEHIIDDINMAGNMEFAPGTEPGIKDDAGSSDLTMVQENEDGSSEVETDETKAEETEDAKPGETKDIEAE